MKIYGVRIYPKSVKVVQAVSAPIYVHGRLNEECSDFFYIFRPLAPHWRGHFFANGFTINITRGGTMEDPLPGLRALYGPHFVDADGESGLVLIHGDGFTTWGTKVHFYEGAFLPIFRQPPAFDLVNTLYWGRGFRLGRDTWPNQLRSVLHMWDDMFWQLFTTDRSEIELLIRTHSDDTRLKMYFVDVEREFPDPSDQKLEPATLDGLAGAI